MKKVMMALGLGAALFLVYPTPEAAAQTVDGKWGIGIRGGSAFLSQDIAEETEGKSGLLISANILYGLRETVSIGLNVEQEFHRVEVFGVDLGDAATTSIISFVEIRGAAERPGPFSPYLSFGLGLNLNDFDLSDTGTVAFTSFDPKSTLALKVTGGADYFVTSGLAINAEFGLKTNSGEVDVCSPFLSPSCGTDDWNLTALTALLGVRYYF